MEMPPSRGPGADYYSVCVCVCDVRGIAGALSGGRHAAGGGDDSRGSVFTCRGSFTQRFDADGGFLIHCV